METFVIVLVILVAIGMAALKISQQASETKGARLAEFGFSVREDKVYFHNVLIGPLAGSEASVTDGTSRHTLTRVVLVAPALTKRTRASLMVAFQNGEVRQVDLKGAASLRQAQSFAVRYNAMATALP
jgi:hypothetical protein